MKNMSFALTTHQFIDGNKIITRRVRHMSKANPDLPVGWANLKPGEHFSAVEKSQGLKKGEKINYLGQCICISNEPEPLNEIIKRPYRETAAYGKPRFDEPTLEGFPELTPKEFVGMFCKEMKCHPVTVVQRIELKKV